MGTVYVLTPDLQLPVGGVRQHYRLVDTLNRAGIHAAVVHRDNGFRCRWFKNSTPIVYASQTIAKPDDLIVIPEELIGLVPKLAPGVPKIVFNQNAYTTLVWDTSPAETRAAYYHPDLFSVLVVSADNVDYIRNIFPELRIDRARYEIDSTLYFLPETKRRVLSYMPRKRSIECKEVISMLQVSGFPSGWEVSAIDGQSEEKAAEMIRDSSIFLSFSYREGFGLPPAEAMASGCIVIGFDGFGGSEFFGEHAVLIPDGDTKAFSSIVMSILQNWESDQKRFSEMAKAAAAFIATNYSRQAHEDSVISVFSEAMAAPRASSGGGRLEVPRYGRPRWRLAAGHLKRALRQSKIAASTKHLTSAASIIWRGYE
jgi:hypothetical protein